MFRELHIPHFYLLGWSVRSWVCELRRFISIKLALDISRKRGEINLAFMAISKIISAKLAVNISRKRGEIKACIGRHFSHPLIVCHLLVFVRDTCIEYYSYVLLPSVVSNHVFSRARFVNCGSVGLFVGLTDCQCPIQG